MKKLGLALSSGAAKGFAHVGVIKELEKNNIQIDYIAGASMGAAIAAHYALYKDIKRLEKLVLNLRRRDLVSLKDFINPKISLIKGEKIERLLKKEFGNSCFKDVKIPLSISATNLEDGSQVIFDSGELRKAVRTSMSFPVVLPPVKYKGMYLVDGGLAEYSPVSLVKKLGAEKILSVDLYNLAAGKLKNNHMLTVLERLQQLLIKNLLKYDEKKADKDVLVIRPNLNKMVDSIKFKQGRKYIHIGEISTREHMEKIKKMLK